MPTLYYIKDQRAPPTSWRLELEQYYIILSLFIGGWGSPGQGATPHPSHAKSPCQSAHCTEPGGICLQPSKIFLQGLQMHQIYLLFIHCFSQNKGYSGNPCHRAWAPVVIITCHTECSD